MSLWLEKRILDIKDGPVVMAGSLERQSDHEALAQLSFKIRL